MLYKVNYQYVGPESELRSASVVVDAKTLEEVKAPATKIIAGKVKDFRIMGIYEWGL